MICNVCGEKIEEGQKFCPKCGAKIEPTSTDKNTTTTSATTNKNLSRTILKICSIGMIFGIVGSALFFGIVLIGLILYGTVFLYGGYDFTKVLTTISIVFMLIGFCSIVAKCILSYIFKINDAKTSTAKKALIILLAVACLGFSIWGFVDSSKHSLDFGDIFFESNCSFTWADYGSDYLSIDTNPYNYDSDNSLSTKYASAALSAIRLINAKLELPSYLYEEMLSTRALDGRQSYSGEKVNVSWRYHPDNGLEVMYSAK
jgi:hypothetical protein